MFQIRDDTKLYVRAVKRFQLFQRLSSSQSSRSSSRSTLELVRWTSSIIRTTWHPRQLQIEWRRDGRRGRKTHTSKVSCYGDVSWHGSAYVALGRTGIGLLLFARLNRVLGSESEELGSISGLSPEQGLKLKDESINKISCGRSAYERFRRQSSTFEFTNKSEHAQLNTQFLTAC